MILVFGRGGQVANSLKVALKGQSAVFLGRQDADFTEPDLLPAILDKYEPEVVIIASAYTAVDKAESEKDLAFLVNATAPGVIARWCSGAKVPLIHYSTDYVYTGEGTEPWLEGDPVNPPNIYGQSKLEGEENILASRAQALIFRTSWVYSYVGQNFVKTMLRLAGERETLRIVSDQVGGPTYAEDIAAVTVQIIEKIRNKEKIQWGIYHLAGSGFTSWYDFAQEIFSLAQKQGLRLKIKEVLPILTSDYPTPAKRPLNSRLNQNKLKENFGLVMPSWRDSLADCILRLSGDKA